MSIESALVSVYVVPTDRPEADGTFEWDRTTVVAVRLREAGEEGLGWTYAPRAAAGVIDELLAPVVVGRDGLDIPAAHAAMRRALRNAGATGIGAAALSAVDIALWDLKARRLGIALSSLLGRVRDAVPVYGSGGFTSYDEETMRRQLDGWLEHGIGDVKIKIGESRGTAVERDLTRVRVVRETIGDRAGLFVDANGGYSVGQARRVEVALRDQGVSWFEEPVSSDDPHGLAAVRMGSRADIAAGEYGWRITDFTALLDAEAVDCLQADVTRCGGVTGWLAAAGLAAARGLEISAHCAPRLSAHVAVAAANCRHLEYFHDHVRIEQMLFDDVLPLDAAGSLAPDAGRPGHGMRIRAEAEEWRR